MQLVDREQAEHVEAALQTMKESLQVLREPSQVNIMMTKMTTYDFFYAFDDTKISEESLSKHQSVAACSDLDLDIDIECLSGKVCKPVEKCQICCSTLFADRQ